MQPLEYGDRVVAKVTLYRYANDKRLPFVTDKSPAWVMGEYIGDMPEYDLDGEVTLILPTRAQKWLEQQDDGGWDGQLYLNRVYDEWELVPEEDWPDEVWAAIARKTLLGEIEGEER